MRGSVAQSAMHVGFAALANVVARRVLVPTKQSPLKQSSFLAVSKLRSIGDCFATNARNDVNLISPQIDLSIQD